jgi:hypothetical protein
MNSKQLPDPDASEEALADQLTETAAGALREGRKGAESWSVQAASDAVAGAVDVPVIARGEDPPGIWVEGPKDAEAWVEIGPRWQGGIEIVAVVRGRRYSARINDDGNVFECAAEILIKVPKVD